MDGFDASSVPITVVLKMRGDQDIEMEILQRPFERAKPDPLQDHITRRIGNKILLNPVPPLHAGIGQMKCRDAGGKICDLAFGIPFFVGEESATVSHKQTQVPDASPVNVRIVHLVENSMTVGKPDMTS